jgi:hypothetical protein
MKMAATATRLMSKMASTEVTGPPLILPVRLALCELDAQLPQRGPLLAREGAPVLLDHVDDLVEGGLAVGGMGQGAGEVFVCGSHVHHSDRSGVTRQGDTF